MFTCSHCEYQILPKYDDGFAIMSCPMCSNLCFKEGTKLKRLPRKTERGWSPMVMEVRGNAVL